MFGSDRPTSVLQSIFTLNFTPRFNYRSLYAASLRCLEQVPAETCSPMTSAHPVSQSPVHTYNSNHRPPVPSRPYSDSLLAPEAAFYTSPPPKKQQLSLHHYSEVESNAITSNHLGLRGGGSPHRSNVKSKRKSRTSKGRRAWRKLLWVKQRDCMFEYPHHCATSHTFIDPDNYTDPLSFLARYQRNPRLRPYEFWPLVADSTVIVQHISSVAIFICSFVGIYEDRVSPVSVLSWGSLSTILGWVLWDFWVGQDEASKTAAGSTTNTEKDGSIMSSATSTVAFTPSSQSAESQGIGLGLSLSTSNISSRRSHSHSRSQTSVSSIGISPTLSHQPSHSVLQAAHPATTLYNTPRTHRRLSTVKSALLIYIALLGLSPILKSLTESTTKDSIWAMSVWLMGINIFFFDYSGGVGSVRFPASLSTNAALMASTVLASRLPSTAHVFSLTLFSIEVFGLFPIFRRYLRHISWQGHLALTIALMIGAGAGLGLTISGKPFFRGGWKRAIAGAIIWALGSAVGMGGCSWWLIGLQRYKNVVIGPWDPARPIIRGSGWE